MLITVKRSDKVIIDSKKYNGKCSCGKEHFMTTELCIIEKGCMSKISDYINKCGLSGYSVAVYDENTYSAEGIVRPLCDVEIVLPAKNLHANENGVEMLLKRLPERLDYMIAVGSGTVHDITRYCAYERSIPFVSCPTAASVDGFCSSVAAMTWHGFKKTFVAAAPKLVVADLNTISKAPMFLTRSGFGDMIGKFISLFEWKLSSALCNEYFCDKIYGMTLNATRAVLDAADGIKEENLDSYEKLTYGLIVSGLAMQLLGSSRCASGAEHHISHLIEMEPQGILIRSDALHGEKVGVGTLIASKEYHRLGKEKPSFKNYPPVKDDYIIKAFGDRLAESIIKENRYDAASGITAEILENNFEKIQGLIKEIPEYEELINVYENLGLKTTLSDIGVSEDKLDLILEYSPLVRNRLTLMRLRRAII